MNRSATYLGILLCAVLIVLDCTKPNEPEEHAGGGHPVPNPAICGTICFGSGVSLDPAGTEISVFKIQQESDSSFTWYLADSGYADSTGAYTFDSLEAGRYSIVYEKDEYEAFSGYLHLPADDTVLVLDTICLQPSISIMGVVQQTEAFQVLIRILGMADTSIAEPDVILPDENKYFIFNALPLSDYIMELSVDRTGTEEEKFYISLPLPLVTRTDTTYIDTGYGGVSTVTIKDKVFELVNDHLKITCLVIDN